ncbi:hypothetical protein [Burkholderia sp. Bp9031]|uniref:hypothetical protein n=1 Tax=Burkholderia sp. Bp9031 TaxID=2184566 RepID=UPI001365AB3C|nr:MULTISPECIES: hypothetical protein [Burkholderia]
MAVMSFDVEKNKACLAGKAGVRAPDAPCWEVFLPTSIIQYGNLQQCQLIVLF